MPRRRPFVRSRLMSSQNKRMSVPPMLPLRSPAPAPAYRERAAEARMRAESMTDDEARKTMLRSADLWERMADYEEANTPSTVWR